MCPGSPFPPLLSSALDWSPSLPSAPRPTLHWLTMWHVAANTDSEHYYWLTDVTLTTDQPDPGSSKQCPVWSSHAYQLGHCAAYCLGHTETNSQWIAKLINISHSLAEETFCWFLQNSFLLILLIQTSKQDFTIVKLREREGQRVDLERSLKGHL